jgi:RNA polymerase-binding transcription factor DksA
MPKPKSAKSEGQAKRAQGAAPAKKAAPVKGAVTPAKKPAAPVKKAVTPAKKPTVPAKAAAPAKLPVAASAKKKDPTPKTPVVQKATSTKAKQPTAQKPVDAAPAKIVMAKGLSPNDPWVLQQKERIFQLRDTILESMHGVAKDTLRSRAEGSEASAFGMHQADAGSDAYDRDFALSLLSQEQDALYEIEEALKRIELGTYGVCEMSGKVITRPRLEALPFARYTVECQTEVERQKKLHKARMPVTSLFGLTDEEAAESEEEDQPIDSKE